MIACDTKSWRRAADHPYGQSVLAMANHAIRSATPDLSRSDVAAYFERGDRTAYETPSRSRRVWIACLAASVLMRSDGAALDRLSQLVHDVCNERSWVYPAHYHNQSRSLTEPPPTPRYIDLNSAMTGTLLAQVARLLEDSLDLATLARIREECVRRIVRPYREEEPMHWQSSTHNWNPVCHAAVAGTVVAFESQPAVVEATLGAVTERVIAYLDGFAPDGGCLEGIGYLNYGLSHYCFLAAAIETAGKNPASLLDPERLSAIASGLAAHELSTGRYANFGDAHERVSVSPFLVDYLRRHGIPVPAPPSPSAVDEYQSDLILADLATFSHDREPGSGAPEQGDSVLPDAGRYVLRPRTASGHRLCVAVKGGHNGEPHNHNDLGTFIVHYRSESLLCDLGKDRYTSGHFGPQRYEILSCSSRGHSVPVLNGCFQGVGPGFHCTSRYANETGECRVSLDLTRAYPTLAGVRRFERTVRTYGPLSGGPDSCLLEVDDDLSMSEAADVQEVFWSWYPCTVETGGIVIRSEHTTALLETTDRWDEVSVDAIDNPVIGAEHTRAYRIAFERHGCSTLHPAFRVRILHDGVE